MMAMQDRYPPLRGELIKNEPMSKHTTWRVGGLADRYYKPVDIDDLANYLSQLDSSEPLFWLGLGSNILVRDGGMRGSVIATSGMLNNIELLDEQVVRIEAGVSCAKVARFCAKQNLVGAEFLAGIPGTMGGALAMNAGAFGGETWPLVEAVETIDRFGGCRLRKPDHYEVGYRSVKGPSDEWFVAARLKLQRGDGESSMRHIKGLLAKRSESQPTQQPNAGSVFRNPEGDHAARLIEATGLKGHCIGGACVSEKHANFIVNKGSATAKDIEMLIADVQSKVEERQGVRLKREVHIVGDE